MEYSNLLLNAKDIDEKKGIVSFYFADFDSTDAHGRRMHKNAFNRTFNNNFKRFAHLLNHDPNIIIGKPLEVNTDSKGAYMVSQLSKSSHGQDALIQYQEGIYNEHSFGFLIKDSIQDGKVEIVNELQMFEASTVTWGANKETPMISLNNIIEQLQSNQDTKEVIKKLDFLITKLPFEDIEKYNESLDKLLKNVGSFEMIINKIDELKALLPATSHQNPQKSVNELIQFINDKY